LPWIGVKSVTPTQVEAEVEAVAMLIISSSSAGIIVIEITDATIAQKCLFSF
jgi:hypothetical protein